MFVYAVILSYTVYCLYYAIKAKKCRCTTSMRGRTAIVTGANSGIGFEIALELARRGGRVILACRDVSKGIAAQQKISSTTGNRTVYFRHLDLESFNSIHRFVDEILRTEDHLEVLINNAGTMDAGNELTEDRVVKEAQVNYFGPFLLTMLLLNLLKESAPSRIINVSTSLHRYGRLNPASLGRPARSCWGHKFIYLNSKLAVILFTRKLSTILQASGVTVNCMDPGLANTELYREQTLVIKLVLRLFLKPARDAAQTAVHLALSPHLELATGLFYSELSSIDPDLRAQDTQIAERLWRTSRRVVGLSFDY